MMLQTGHSSGKPHTGPVFWLLCFEEASREDSPKNLTGLVPGLT